MTRKYNSLAEVKAAFDSGELDRATVKLMLDNDNSRLVYHGPAPQGLPRDMEDEFYDKKHEELYDLFRGNGYADLREACELAGIPAEWC